MRVLLALPLILAACATAPITKAPHQSEPMSRATRIAAECALLLHARERLIATARPAPQDIVVGCAGFEAAKDEMPLKAQSAALRAANAATLPPEVQRLAPQGEVVYRRMISRGVPESLAAELAPSALFRTAAGK